jgi:hypothetical protein
VVCAVEFWKSDPRTVCCSRVCGGVVRRGARGPNIRPRRRAGLQPGG